MRKKWELNLQVMSAQRPQFFMLISSPQCTAGLRDCGWLKAADAVGQLLIWYFLCAVNVCFSHGIYELCFGLKTDCCGLFDFCTKVYAGLMVSQLRKHSVVSSRCS